MVKKHDLVIRGGTIVDGSGARPFDADIAVNGEVITAVGTVMDGGRLEIDAEDRLVTPGFVDLHTHYDGHVTWSNRLSASGEHGVTTVLMGNCGIGFAPCRAGDRTKLVRLMEGIEDIPEAVMIEGLPWNWETLPEYMDRLAERVYDTDIAVQVPHAAVRLYVMGNRALLREAATDDDICAMRQLTREAIRAGALGFSTSRNIAHMARDGTVTPSYSATAEELEGIAIGLRDAQAGVLQLGSDLTDFHADLEVMRRMMSASGRPLTYCLVQMHNDPDGWKQYLDRIAGAADEGFCIKAQVSSRFLGVFLGLRLIRNPFMATAAYGEIAKLPFVERLARMRRPELRSRILSEMPGDLSPVEQTFIAGCEEMYEFDGNYEPPLEQRLDQRASALGTDPDSLAYDILTKGDGSAVLCRPLVNYANCRSDAIKGMICSEHTIPGNSDAGAHLGLIFDASMTTHLIERWSDVGRGTIPIARVIKALAFDTARAIGLNDRGLLAVGYRADINVIDPGNLSVKCHEVVKDLPGGRPRLHQSAAGYDATIVAGEITYRNGRATGAFPGRLVRGNQPSPESSQSVR